LRTGGSINQDESGDVFANRNALAARECLPRGIIALLYQQRFPALQGGAQANRLGAFPSHFDGAIRPAFNRSHVRNQFLAVVVGHRNRRERVHTPLLYDARMGRKTAGHAINDVPDPVIVEDRKTPGELPRGGEILVNLTRLALVNRDRIDTERL